MKYLFFLIPFFGLSQKIFTVNYSSQSDIKVFVVDYESQADLNVFKVDYESQSKGNEGLWYFQEETRGIRMSVMIVAQKRCERRHRRKVG